MHFLQSRFGNGKRTGGWKLLQIRSGNLRGVEKLGNFLFEFNKTSKMEDSSMMEERKPFGSSMVEHELIPNTPKTAGRP